MGGRRAVIALRRQILAPLPLGFSEENGCARGAYQVAGADGGGRVSLCASGSEVGIALDAKSRLDAQGTPARVVSVPCFELFAEQSAAYRREVLGNAPVRVGIEAAGAMGWDRFIGADGTFVGMEGFGASGPYEALYRHFGITAEAVVEKVNARLAAMDNRE